jgi:putative ABC transport system permease protein
MAILIAVPSGIAANQTAAQNLTGDLGETIKQTQATINQTLTQIKCTLSPNAPSGTGGFATGSARPIGSGAISIGSLGGGSFSSGGSEPMNQTAYSGISNINGVAAVQPALQVTQGHTKTVTPTILNPDGSSSPGSFSFNITVPDYIINGIPLNTSLIDNYPVLPTNITHGRNLQADETGVVLLSENCSAYFKANVGDTINILGKDFKVVGIFSPSGIEDNQYLYMDLADAQAITNNTDTITSLYVYAETKENVNAVANEIASRYPELNVETAQQRLSQLQQMETIYNNQLKQAQETMNQTNIQATIEIVIAVAATSMITLFVMLYTVRDRTKEIGTLKAIGASSRTIMGQFMVEGIMLSALAGVVGVAISIVAAPFLSSVLLPALGNNFGGGTVNVISINSGTLSPANVVSVTPEFMLIGFGVAVLLGALGSMYPSWRAAKIRPAEAMRYE